MVPTLANPQEAIPEMVRRIVERFHPEKIILFGSHARGDPSPDSDVDLMVVFSEVEDRRQRAVEIDKLLWKRSFPIDVKVTTSDRLLRFQNVPNTIYWPVVREGKILYERESGSH